MVNDVRPDETEGGSPIRVLIVDDHSDVRELLAALLADAGGFRIVGEAGDGEAGLAAAEQYSPDLIVLDLSMPKMDGLEALPLLKARVPGVKILVASSFGVDAVVHAALQAGADAYVVKGMDLVATFVPTARALVPGPSVATDDRATRPRTGEP